MNFGINLTYFKNKSKYSLTSFEINNEQTYTLSN
jgi:hypothetical protein